MAMSDYLVLLINSENCLTDGKLKTVLGSRDGVFAIKIILSRFQLKVLVVELVICFQSD